MLITTACKVGPNYDGWYDCDERQVCANPRSAASFPGGPGCVDVDGDLTIDFFDYDAFVMTFEAGCN